MGYKQCFLSISSILMFLLAELSYALPAFPGAEGFGANSVGGRGGKVIHVTNLNDSGAGSFREAVSASGPRTVVFDVSGIINLQSSLEIKNDNITVAGQTSPGGILITGGSVRIRASDVIVRFMRFRAGNHAIADRNADPETLDSLQIWGHDTRGASYTENIIVDHCSIGWGVDETMDLAYGWRNVTLSNSIVAEGLSNAGHPKGEHSKGLLVWNKYSPNSTITLFRNYFASSQQRNPQTNNNDGSQILDAVNNVTYNNGGGYAMGTTSNDAKTNWRHNYVKPGPISNSSYMEIYAVGTVSSALPYTYAIGNIGVSRTEQGGSEWTVGSSFNSTLQDTAFRSLTPWETAGLKATTMTASFADTVVAEAGATVPVTDSADQNVKDDYTNGTGGLRNSIAYPSEFPTYSTAKDNPLDTDRDGMIDAWETANGFNINVDDANDDGDNDGYTNIEEYFHYLAGDVAGVMVSPPMAPPSFRAQ